MIWEKCRKESDHWIICPMLDAAADLRGMCSITITSLDDFKNRVGSLGSEFLYRGQADRSWEAHTKYWRWCQKHKKKYNLQELFEMTDRILKEEPELDSHLRAMAFAQHYDGRTDLLDLTYDAMVALHFMLGPCYRHKAGVVYAVNLTPLQSFHSDPSKLIGRPLTKHDMSPELKKILEDVKPGDRSMKIPVLVPGLENPRMQAQKGSFVFLPDGLSLEKLVMAYYQNRIYIGNIWDSFKLFVVPSKVKTEMLKEMDWVKREGELMVEASSRYSESIKRLMESFGEER